ncbi:diadenosine tetraphosphate (Ap4A) HIT family hydrolase [Thermosporothrix hazakensis]|jgi:diadenosine tetraphosphate (Ap4A) HIT family hydrolase|uniref:Diadenosine tetraphosphate (Ap4A) HIT family hydrolase n=2 Tax=Thermosporothrix TaxID=768650 RepID=A0A326UAY1_THEHA|nr:HIT family protein [Thermosporothrix hazakensis]PZW32100.1 diadenosine tetraphosphate (Ap4A) HIT family hydrolase [Thermosporothrix hazakensis]BBH91426.1 hypothetical protein KTC_61770 [Thermosporothrix sp. COM3]GCE49572.1 hypothetical protein KTH_44410 [Thermosporothrix hazakensis]
MQQQSSISAASAYQCPFCQKEHLSGYILRESASFYIVVDHAPLLKGHLLIIPKKHYSCYGAVPAELDNELQELKQEVAHFFSCFYQQIAYWEHGVFHQSVFHAHLHCFPLGPARYDLSEQLHVHIVKSQDDVRQWYQQHGHYFYFQSPSQPEQQGLIFPPDRGIYDRIARQVIWPSVAAQTGQTRWHTAAERLAVGQPAIAETRLYWKQFQTGCQIS